jgi:hypothetical protein
MLSTLGERIHDNRFLRLVEGMLKAGYLEDWLSALTEFGSGEDLVERRGCWMSYVDPGS